jgi:hypothetical protein
MRPAWTGVQSSRSRVIAADVAVEYLRPTPAQSDYLNAATNPVPWPTRSGPRQPRSRRPTLGAEKRLTGSKRAAALTRTAAPPL